MHFHLNFKGIVDHLKFDPIWVKIHLHILKSCELQRALLKMFCFQVLAFVLQVPKYLQLWSVFNRSSLTFQELRNHVAHINVNDTNVI